MSSHVLRTQLRDVPTSIMSSADAPVDINSISEEVLTSVLVNLNDGPSVKSASVVSHKFRRCIFKHLWRSVNIDLGCTGANTSVPFFQAQTSIAQNVRRLDLGANTTHKWNLSAFRPDGLLDAFPNLEFLLIGTPQIELFPCFPEKMHSLTIRTVAYEPYRLLSDTAARKLMESANLRHLEMKLTEDLPPLLASSFFYLWLEIVRYPFNRQIETLRYSLCDSECSWLIRSLEMKALCLDVFHVLPRRHSHPDGCGTFKFLRYAPHIERLAFLAKDFASHQHAHNQYMYKILREWSGHDNPIRDMNVKELTIPEKPTFTCHNHQVLYLPRRLEVLQIHAWDTEGLSDLEDEDLERERKLARLAAQIPPHGKWLKRIVWWYDTEGGRRMQQRSLASLLKSKAQFEEVGIVFEVCEASSFGNTPFGWKHGI